MWSGLAPRLGISSLPHKRKNSISNCWFSAWALSLSRVQFFANPRTVAHQTPLSIDSRQEYWSGLPFPTPWVLPNPGIDLTSSAVAGEFFPLHHLGSPGYYIYSCREILNTKGEESSRMRWVESITDSMDMNLANSRTDEGQKACK